MADCAGVHEQLRRGQLDAGGRAHVQGCPACAELAADDGALARTLEQLEPLEPGKPELELAALETELARRTGWLERLRQRSTRARAATLAGVGIGIAGLVGVAMARPDLPVHPLPRLLGAVTALAVAVVAAGAVALRPLHRRPLPGAVVGVAAAVAVLAPVIVAALPAAHHDHPASMGGLGDELVPRALGCFVFGAIWALIALAAAWALDRAGLRRKTAAAFALLGAAALGNVTLVLHCPLVEPGHQLAGHASLVGAAVVALVFPGLRRR